MLRKIIKVAGGTLLGLLVLIGFAVVSPRWAEPLTGPLRTVLVRAIAGAISISLDGSLQIGSLAGSLLKNPTLSDITLKDTQGETVASIDELRLRYSLRGLLQGLVRIQAVEIVKPEFSLVEEADGRLNLEQVLALEPTDDTPFPLTVKLDKLALEDGHISLQLPDVPGTRAIEDIALQLRGQIDPQGFRVKLQELTARTKPSNVVLKTLRGDLSQTAGAIKLKDWLLQTAKSTVTLSGTFPLSLLVSESRLGKPPASEPRPQPGWQTPIAARDCGGRRSDPSEAAKRDPPEPSRADEHSNSPPLDGASLSAETEAAPPDASRLTLALHPLDVAEIGRILGNPSWQGELEGTITTTQADSALNVMGRLAAGERGTLVLDAALNPKCQPPRYQGSLTVSEVDLAALVNKPGLASDINLRLEVAGEGFEHARRSGRLRVAIERSHVGDIAIEPSEIRVEVGGERFEVQAFDLNTSILEAELEGEINLAGRSSLSYSLSLAPADLKQLIAANTLGGNIAVTGQVRGEWPQIATNGVLTGKELIYDDTRLETFRLAYEATDLGRYPRADAQLQAQDLSVGTRGVEALSAQSTYTYQGGTHRLQFGAITDKSSQLYASIKGTLTASDARQTLVIPEFEARLDDHSWHAMTPLQATRAAEKTRLKPFRLTHDRESIEVAGALVGDALENVRLRATEIDLNFLQRVFSLPPIVAGRASWEADVSGSLSAPTLKSRLTMRSSDKEAPPLEGAKVALSYENGQLDSALSVIQKGRQTVTLHCALPIDLGLVAKPIEQRLGDEPLRLELAIEQPSMALLNQAIPELPEISGTVTGKFAISGTYDNVTVNGNAELQQLGIKGAARHLNAPMHLAANMVSAPSVAALRKAIAIDEVTVAVPQLTFRMPSLSGELAGQESATPLSLRDVLAEISAKWHGDTLTSASTHLAMYAEVGELPPMNLTSNARLESEQLTVEQVALKTPASEFNGVGEISLRDRSIQFSLDIPLLQLGEFEGLVPPEIALEGDRQGGHRRHSGNARAQRTAALRRGPHQRRRLGTASGTASALSHQRAHQQLRGGAVPAGIERPAAGSVGPSRVTDSSRRASEARIGVDVRSTGFAVAPGLAARVRSRVTGSTVSVDLFDVTSEPLEFRARGIFSTTQPTDLQYSLVLRDLSALEKRLGVALQASGELTGQVAGDFDALKTRGKLKVNDWRYGPWQGNGLRANVDGRTLTTAPAVTFQANINDVRGPQLSPSSIRLEGRFANETGAFSLEVTKGPFGQSKIAGVLDTKPNLQARIDPLRLKTEQWTWSNAEPIEVLYDAEQVLVLRNLELKNAAGRISARGKFSPEGALSGSARIQDLQIKPTVSAFAPSAPVPDGKLSLNLEVNGTVAQPELDGTLQVAGLKWTEQPVGDVNAEFASSGLAFRGNASWLDRGDVLLSVAGNVDAGTSKHLALDVKAPNFDLAKLESFSPSIERSAGRLRIDLDVRGTLDQPSANGVLEVQDGHFLYSAIGEPYRDIQTRAVFKGNRLAIERFELGSSTGTASLEGWLETAGLALSQANLMLDAKDFTAVNTQAIEAVVSSKVAVRGSQEALLATGNVTVPRARIRYENLPATGPSEVEPWELTVEGVYGAGPETAAFGAVEGTSAKTEMDPLSSLRADIELDMPRNIWIQGKGTAVELSGKLQLKKDLGQPFVLAGDVQTLRGFATLLGRKFNIEKGGVTFTGSEDINPILDISASYQVSDYTVSVNATGESKKPEISYSSEPELDQQDILSLLIFGKTSDRLTSSEQTTLGSKAEQFAGGLAAGVLQQTFGKALGLDTVAIEVGDQGSASTVGAGRYLSQDLYVEYKRTFRSPLQGSRTGNAVVVEYSISDELKAEATGSDYGETALDFVWSRDY